MAPELSLPPQPVLTRWGTWISAALYCCNNFSVVKDIVDGLDVEDASSIRIVKSLIQKQSMQNDLSFITASFSNIPKAIVALEQQNLTLVNALQLFMEIIEEIDQVPGDKGKLVQQKCSKVMLANTDLV